MPTLTQLNEMAVALKAENIAKHKANGKTHRVELELFDALGHYVRTVVFYTKGTPNVARMALECGSKSLGDSVMNSKVEEL